MPEEKTSTQIVHSESMKSFCIEVCKTIGLSEEDSTLLADTMVQADLRGIHSHGVTHLIRHIRGFIAGEVNKSPSIKIMQDSGATAVMDGDNGLGRIVAYPAMKLAMDKASHHGIGAVVIRNSNQYGAACYWSMMALKLDMIGYTTTNTTPGLAPWGGVTPSYGNNPISYAIPAKEQWPIVLDMAMSVVASGKIQLAALKKEPIPEGWALDKDGKPTTDAQAAREGLLMPIAGHKGYGLAIVNEILCGVLSGGIFARDIPRSSPDCTRFAGYSHFFMALDIDHFINIAEFKERVDKMILMIKDSKLAAGYEKIYLPGERGFETHHQRVKEGIPYPIQVIEQLRGFVEELGMSINLEIGG